MDRAPKRIVSVGAGTTATFCMLACLALWACVPSAARGATRYVRVSGNDASDGLSPSRALRHVTRAAALADPGDRIVVGPGVYDEGDIKTTAFGEVSFIADRRGREVGDPPGDVVLNASGFGSGFELNRNLGVTIDGFVIYGASVGIYVKTQSQRAVISNNIVSNNTTNGIYVQDSKDALVFNNLVYNNARTGILITGNEDGSPGARIVNNTVYANLNRGIFFSGARTGSTGGLVINNIVVSNAVAGIQVNSTSRDGYVSGGNLTFDNRYASGTPVDVTDTEADPRFISASGPDQMLGGGGYADDDFHLSHKDAGQAISSAAINMGSDLSRHLGLDRASTRTDGRWDRSVVDAGYHYDNFRPARAEAQFRLRYKPIYVSPSKGDDANSGATPSTALQSLKRALKLAQAGHRLVLLSGRYQEGELGPTNSGTQGRPIIIQAMGGAVIDATGSSRGLLLAGKSYITLDGLEVVNAQDTGIEIRDSFGQAMVPTGVTSIVLRRCRLHDNGRRGLYVDTASNISVESCTIEHNGSRGIQVQAGQLAVARTLVRQNPDTGLWAFAESNVAVTRTDFVDNATDGLLIEQSDLAITGGVIRGSKDGGLRFKAGSTGIVRDVVVTGNTDLGVQGISSAVNISGGRVEGSQVGIQVFIDPVSRASNELAVTGTRVCGNTGAGIDAEDTKVSVNDATLCNNGSDGLRQKGGDAEIIGTELTQNEGEGFSFTGGGQVIVRDLLARENRSTGVQIVSAASISISGSVLGRNGGDGLTILDSPAPMVWNNLLHENASSGMVISGDIVGSPNAQILNNTVYGNINRGVLLGGSDVKPPSTGALVMRNVFRGNGNAGLQVNTLSLPDFVGNYNLTTDAYVPVMLLGPNDVLADPMFVDPANEDFHLSQRAAGQNVSSPAVDAGGIDVVAAGVNGMTTRSDRVPDAGIADLGYHYVP